MAPEPESLAAQLFESSIDTIRSIVRWTCARQRFGQEDAEEFSSYVMLNESFARKGHRWLRALSAGR